MTPAAQPLAWMFNRNGTASAPTEPQNHYYDEWGDWYPDSTYERMAKTDARVGYKLATPEQATAKERCYDCRFYQWGTCNLVEGTVEASFICNLYAKTPEFYPMELHDIAAKGSPIRLTIERQNFADKVAPDWIQYWPAPGRFNHPQYGEIVITSERNQRMLDNFKNKVYPMSALPVDCDHNLAVSGAVGYIEDMRMAADGSLEAFVNWNDIGKGLIEQDRFRYFSPSVIPEWPHTLTGERIADVAIGGAICNNPYFTETWLRPLVATRDGGLTTYERSKPSTKSTVREVRVVNLEPQERQREFSVDGDEKNPKGGGGTAGTVVSLTDAEVQAFRAFQAAGGLAAISTLQDTVKRQSEELNTVKSDNRTARFSAIIAGVETFEDGTTKQGNHWVGERTKLIGTLSLIADAKGEDSQEFKDHLETMRAAAAAVTTGKLFKEIGGSAGGGDDEIDAAARVTEMANDIVTKSNGKTNYTAAMKEVERDNPELFAQYREQASFTNKRR